MKPYVKAQWKRNRIFLIMRSDKRNEYLKKNHIFADMGENVFFQPRVIPSDPKLVKFHNNIVVTSNVTFVTHDVFHMGLNNLNKGVFPYEQNAIEIMDNVFIGCNSTLIGPLRVGPNAVIAAGSIVTKDVPENSVVAGNPAKVIDTFENFVNKRKEKRPNNNIEEAWNNFYQEKNQK